MSTVTLCRIRLWVRAAAGTIGLVAAAYGGSAVQSAVQSDRELDGSLVRWSVTSLMILGGIWIIVEAVIAGFEEIRARTQERYDRLEQQQPDAYAIAGQAVCETLRVLQEQAAEDSAKVRVIYR